MPTGRQSDPFYDQELPVEGIAAISNSLQHETEVEEHIEREGLSPAERAIYLLQNGSTLQKHSVLENLGRLQQECSGSDMSRVISEIGELIWKMEQDLQILAGESIKKCLPAFKPKHLLEMFGVLRTMSSIRVEVVREKFRPCILEAVQCAPKENLATEVLSLAIEKGEPSEPQDSRKLSCEMFGALSKRLDGPTVEKLFLSKALSLCQDTDYGVRMTMCAQLGTMAQAIGVEKTKQHIMKELQELLVDEEKEVQRSALTALVDLAEFLDEPFRRDTVLPMLRGYLTSPPDATYGVLLSLLGKSLHALCGEQPSEEDAMLFCNFFRSSALRTDPDAQAMGFRPLCAYNFPAMVKCIGFRRYTVYLQATFKLLCEDSTAVETRRRMAAGFHEVSSLLGEKSFNLLKDSFLQLIRDSALEVQEAIFPHFSDVLHHFNQPAPSPDREAFFASCVGPLVAYETAVTKRWRRVGELLEQFEDFPVFFALDVLYEQFLPILFRHLSTGSMATKDKCAEMIMLFTRKLNNNQQQVEIFGRLLQDFARSRSCWHRQSFVLVCHHCLRFFSRKFFREKFLESALDLAKDPISNVRRALCPLLPHIFRTLRPPAAPPEAISMLYERLNKLCSDPDRDVAAAAAEAQTAVDDINRELKRRSEERMVDEEERLDAQREDEENNLFEAAQEQEKQQRRRALRELLAEGEKSAPLSGGPAQIPLSGKGRVGVTSRRVL
eukprot:RCo015427